MRLALLFPGQGVQHAGMLPWIDDDLAALPALALMVERIGSDWRARLHDAAWASTNATAQCLMTGTSLAAWQVLGARLPKPIAIAGYSVGELAAYAAAGVFEAAQALSIATLRAEAMDRAAVLAPGTLMSVIGATKQTIAALCVQAHAEIAICISPDRVVLGGSSTALDAVAAALAGTSADIVRLQVQVASHTSAMKAAAAEIAHRLTLSTWTPPDTALVVGYDGTVLRQVDALKRALAAQTDHTVQWETAMQTIAERRPDRVLEVGAGSSLSRIWRAAYPDVPVRSVDEFGTAEAIVRWATH